jgi:hypothetical protein
MLFKRTVFKRQLDGHLLERGAFLSQLLHRGRRRLSPRVRGKALFAGCQKFL